MKVVFFGTSDFVIPVLDSLQNEFELVGVVTGPDRKAGRKLLIKPSPVKKHCLEKVEKKTLQVFDPQEFDETTIKELKALAADVFVVAAYGKILPEKVISIPAFGAVNIHPSLLPKYRGPSPIQETILNGDKMTGVTFIKMDKQVDHGPILEYASFETHPTDTFDTLARHLFNKAAEMICDVLKNYAEGRTVPQPQTHSLATFTGTVTKENGFLDPEEDMHVEKVEKMIRAYHPWPGVWTKADFGGNKIIKLLPGKLIQMEGKKPVSFKDFINGYPHAEEKLKNVFAYMIWSIQREQ